MTEDQIERRVQRSFDWLDAVYMSGRITTEEYQAAAKRINDEADSAYKQIGR